jgi:hypothetical protein
MQDKVTNISVLFRGVKKRARKVDFHVERLSQIFDDKHQVLTPEDFNQYERKAWELIDALGYRKVTAGAISVNYGSEFQGILSIELFPKQKQPIMRGE